MSCWRTRRKLSSYIDGELSPSRARAVAGHLAGCPACAGRERALRAAWEELRGLPAPPAGADLWPGVLRGLAEARPTRVVPVRRYRLLVPVAVAACAAAGLAVGTWFASEFPAAPPPAHPAARRAAANDSFADAFGDPLAGLLAGSPESRGGGRP